MFSANSHASALSAQLDSLQLKRGVRSHMAAQRSSVDESNDPLSPCYLHGRFDDAVDLEKVLEEMTADEAMSHSRLVQTATGVREMSKQLQRTPIKRAVRNVVIVTKARDNHLVVLTRQIAEWLMSTPRYGSSLGVNVYVDAKLRKSQRFRAADLLAKEPRFVTMLRYWTPELCLSTPEKFDLVLTLGGDGTVLFTSWLFQRIVPPILSFSLGSLGFLTPFDFQSHRQALNRIMGGLSGSSVKSSMVSFNSSREAFAFIDRHTNGAASPVSSVPGDVVSDAVMRVNLRMRFTCTVHRMSRRPSTMGSKSDSQMSIASLASSSIPTTATSSTSSMAGFSGASPAEEIVQHEVLNEIVIDRGPSPYVSNLELYGDDNLLTVIQADGCIFSTPTGSTAYSLSAGGSLVHPSIPAILLTPICPHTLSFRPMLLNDTISLRVAIPKGSRAGAWCSFDGKGRVELRQGDYVTIRASRYPFATVISEKGEDWIDSVSRTLRWNTREARQKSWSSTSGRGGGRRTSTQSVNLGASTPISEAADEYNVDAAQSEFDEEEVEGEGSQEEEFDIDFDDDDENLGPNSGPPSGAVPSRDPPTRKSTMMSELSI